MQKAFLITITHIYKNCSPLKKTKLHGKTGKPTIIEGSHGNNNIHHPAQNLKYFTKYIKNIIIWRSSEVYYIHLNHTNVVATHIISLFNFLEKYPKFKFRLSEIVSMFNIHIIL